MEKETYSKDNLQKNLYFMVKAGLLDIRIREDGQWLYEISDSSKSMTEYQKIKLLEDVFDPEENDF